MGLHCGKRNSFALRRNAKASICRLDGGESERERETLPQEIFRRVDNLPLGRHQINYCSVSRPLAKTREKHHRAV